MGYETGGFHQREHQLMKYLEFNEVQRFRVRWAWAAVIVINGLFIYAIVQQVVMGKPFGNKPASNLTLVLIELGPLAVLFFLNSIKLKTSIDQMGIHYCFFPFQLRTTTIHWDELRDAYMREYNSFHEYGGWGIRIGSAKTGNAVNTSASGKVGLQLQFKDGKLLLIGTKQPGAIEKIISEIIASGKINRGI